MAGGWGKCVFTLNYIQRRHHRYLFYIYMLRWELALRDALIFLSFRFDWMIFLSSMHNWAQVSAWLRIHLRSLQSDSVTAFLLWVNHKGTVWWMEDETRTDLSLQTLPPPLSGPHSSPDPCLCGLLSLGGVWHPRPLLFPVHTYGLSPPLPSALSHTSLLRRSNSRTLLYPTCMHKSDNGSWSNVPTTTSTNSYLHIYMCVCVCIYIYIYTQEPYGAIWFRVKILREACQR